MPTSAPRNCFVAMFDILGFKALRKLRGTAGLNQLYTRSIAAMIQHAAAGSRTLTQTNGETFCVPRFTPYSLRYRAISDTAIFFTPDDSFTSFLIIVHCSFFLLQSGFAGTKAPFRGAIGWGDLIDDDSGILIGSALEDAYDGERRQAWAGCMLTNECRSLAGSMGYLQRYREFHLTEASKLENETGRKMMIENAERLVEYRVQLKADDRKGKKDSYSTSDAYVIDWTIRMYEGAAASSFLPSDCARAQAIAKNTIEFEKWARSRCPSRKEA
jgi:hypothetical protein